MKQKHNKKVVTNIIKQTCSHTASNAKEIQKI